MTRTRVDVHSLLRTTTPETADDWNAGHFFLLRTAPELTL
jgi:hypothetical protein